MPNQTQPVELSIDELAQATGTTVRNVRSYQDRGLLPPPRRRGRKGIYSDAHQARLRIINRLLERGYTLANIAELIQSWEDGDSLAHLLGLEAAVASPWNDELAGYMSTAELAAKFGGALSDDAMHKAVELDIIRPEGAHLRIPSPRTLNAAAELAHAGIPLERTLALVATLRQHMEQTADSMVALVTRHVFDRYGEGQLPPAEAMPELTDIVWRLRPVVEMTLLPELSRAMEKAADQHFGDRLVSAANQQRDIP